MNSLVSVLLFLTILQYSYCGPLRLQKRAAFYIANETACVVDNTVYSNGDPIPTDDPCEACKCRPPGFACVLKECEVKPGCRAVRRTGHCCPDYVCGCEHNGRMYRDGDEIRDSQNPCYTCHCQGSSIACAFIDCFFRVDCAPEYVPGECCPRYTNCTEPKNQFDGSNPYLKDKEVDVTIVPTSVIVPGVSYVEDTTEAQNIDTTVIEIFEIETKEPELLQLNPEAVSIDETVNEESSEKSSEENIPEKNINPIESGTSDIEEKAAEETISVKNDELKVDEADTTEQSVTHHEVFTPKIDSDEEESVKSELSTKVSSQPEIPVAVENVDVEPEEPSNNLESGNLSSDYGKSLKFDDTNQQGSETESKDQESETESKDQKSETESKEQKSETESEALKSVTEMKEQNTQTEQESSTEQKENQTQQPQKLLYSKETSSDTLTTPKIQEETISHSTVIDEKLVNTELTSNSDSTEKIALYVAKDSLKTESVETVTVVVEVKDKITTPVADKTDLSVTPTIIASLFKSNSDKLEDQKSTMLPGATITKNDKTEDLELHLSSISEMESSSAKAEVSPTTFSKGTETTITID
ncbi:uncharacterized protein [Parasteatoda tepidariorum]|uniref:uncharacterized protein isoform X2 n=1 Tax=Parasteatoda tepidariorum TaxID=114398 RepID=UPI001C723C14|nr:uncharacterized protein LOC107436697 isoform X2 [Parasteatoda tepidariorum]